MLDAVEADEHYGYPLQGEWEGCRAVHCVSDRYRVIWEDQEPIEDYEGQAEELVEVAVLRVALKKSGKGTIYSGGRRGT